MPKRLAVIHLNTARTWRGGEQQTFNLVAGLHARGVPVGLVCQPNTILAQKANACGLPVFEVSMKSEADFNAALKIRKICQRYNPGIIHAHTAHAHTLAYWATLGLPVKRLVSRRVDFSIYRHDFMKINRLKYKYMAHHYIAISQSIKNVLLNDGLNADNVSVVYSGVDHLRFSAVKENEVEALRNEFNVKPNTKVILNAAQLSWEKGQYALICAMPTFLHKYPDSMLFLLGAGDQTRLQNLIYDLGLEGKVLMPGFRKDVGAFYKLSHLYIMPSVYEGLGTAVLDALALKKPLIVTNGGGLGEIVTDNVNGRLVYMNNFVKLGEALKHAPGLQNEYISDFANNLSKALLQTFDDYDAGLSMAEAGHETLMRKFTFDAMVAGNLEVYKKLAPQLMAED